MQSQLNRDGSRSGSWARSALAKAMGGDGSTLAAEDQDSFRGQELAFASLNLMLIGALLLLQEISRLVRGKPAPSVIFVLAIGFVIQAIYFVWLRSASIQLFKPTQRIFAYWSLGFNSTLALVLTSLTIGGDTAYYALMLIPILEAAFRLGLAATCAVILVAVFVSFMGAWGLKFGEYIEAGAMSVIYGVMGVLVWMLVNNLRAREGRLVRSLEELARTREQLLSEEKLAAVGRLSRALAHEIRNPVAMISSSLATAVRPGQNDEEREEMFAIAAKEATRLERLTTDFLLYARPRTAQLALGNLTDTLNYVATVARAYAANKGVAIDVSAAGELEGEFDATQIQQALLNLVLNAIDACHRGDSVKLNAELNGNGSIRIDVAGPAAPIPPEVAERIFEPLFTTKPGGNGLGLPIARNIARAHGGDVVLGTNEPGRVCFSIEIPSHGS